jgi:hypothetical protein
MLPGEPKVDWKPVIVFGNPLRRCRREFWRISRSAMEGSARGAIYFVKIKNHSLADVLAMNGAFDAGSGRERRKPIE